MKKAAVNFLLLTAVLLGLFLACELGLRLSQAVQAGIKLNKKNARISGFSPQVKDLNVFYFGESTMESSALQKVSLPRLVEFSFGGKINGRRMASFNFGEAGSDAHAMLAKVRSLFSSQNAVRPNLVVIQEGHNIFLSREESFLGGLVKYQNPVLDFLFSRSAFFHWVMNRLSRLKGCRPHIQDRSFVDEPVVPLEDYGKIRSQYQSDIREAVSIIHQAVIPVILIVNSSNLKDWEPNRSLCSFSAKEEKEKFEEKFRSARESEKDGDLDGASKKYSEVLEVCPGFSEAYFRSGVLSEKKGEYLLAKQFYQKALDSDGMPVRASSKENEFLRSLCSEKASELVFCADAENSFSEYSAHALTGNNLIYDNVHPVLEGYVLMANTVSEKVHRIFGGPRPEELNAGKIKKEIKLMPEDYFEAAIKTGRYLTRIATWRYGMEERLRRADLFFKEAAQISPARFEPYLGFAMTSLLRRDTASAEKYLEQARNFSENGTKTYLNQDWARYILTRAYSKGS